jgi:hypothetical protein
MASLNICDQRVIDAALPLIKGKGFIARSFRQHDNNWQGQIKKNL